MDKQLKKLKAEYEKRIPISFTKEEQLKVIDKVRFSELKKTNRYRCFLPRLAAGLSIILLIFVISSFDNFDFEESISSSNDSLAEREGSITEELTVGGRINLKEYPSNFHLYMAHLLSVSIISDVTANKVEDSANQKEILMSLRNLKEELTQIKYKKDKRAEFQKVIKLTNEALKEDHRDTLVLTDIHNILHELDRYYNNQRFLDDI